MSDVDIVQSIFIAVFGAIAIRAWGLGTINTRSLELVAEIFRKKRGPP